MLLLEKVTCGDCWGGILAGILMEEF